MITQLQPTQVSILHSLRYSQAERFSSLMRPTGYTSDNFKFHLRKLTKLGYIEKLNNGMYQLTPAGKEFANNLDEPKRVVQKQPKVSVLMVIAKKNANNETVYLVQNRLRNPYFGFWSEIHGRAEWGEPFEATAKRQLKRQTSLEAKFKIHGFRRVRDYDEISNELLEDKLFVILKATDISGELSNTYSGGTNAWMTLKDLRAEDKVFASTLANIQDLENGNFYKEQDIFYPPGDY
ncbi:MAG TPA: NUDIX domain-containing protein [Candidatus Saccharimonadales bacterium]|nr:NUDIX domain-containing protein [Candidatus Saccharimonadales bacterium]